MSETEDQKIHYEFKLNKDKTVLRGKTTLALLKKIITPSNRGQKSRCTKHDTFLVFSRIWKTFDWAFATNQDEIDLEYIVPTYKGRWRIETGFRVQDEARIKSKSKDMKIRFFYFVYEQTLQFLWAALYKDELRFKAFIIEMYEMSDRRVTQEERKSARANV